MPDRILSIENLQSGYGDVRVLWDVSLDVNKGEIVCIVGSNGAGKTTLLRTISGLLTPNNGSIVFDGEAIEQADPDFVLSHGIAHVPEGRRLFKGLSVRDNLLLGAYLRRDADGVLEDLEFIYSLFPILKDRQKQDATTLSGGEQQMCAIGRGIMSRPKMLMIDELSLGLAPRLVDRLSTALLEINKTGLTILLVEQDVMTAFEVASRAFVVESGRITMHGETAELSSDPGIREAYMGL